MSATNTQQSSTEGGLKYQIARQRNMKDAAEAHVGRLQQYMINTLFRLRRFDYEEYEMAVWEFALTERFTIHIESHLVGEYSRIGDYVNKKGDTTKAHFSNWGNYLGSVKKLGDKPISYMGHFRITEDKFEVHPTITGGMNLPISALFRPKTGIAVPEIYVSPEAEPTPAPVKTIKLKRKVKQPIALSTDSE